jgi:hypothetical protein
MEYLRLLVRRWWWAKWHPLVHLGWIVTRNNRGGVQSVTYAGFGLIVAGLVLRSRKSLHLHTATVSAGQEMQIRVLQGDRTIATG